VSLIVGSVFDAIVGISTNRMKEVMGFLSGEVQVRSGLMVMGVMDQERLRSLRRIGGGWADVP
jgi:hypothetical protein